LPAATAVTLTENVQEPLAAIVPPFSTTLCDPAAAVTVPPHEPLNALGVATANPAGKLSVNAIPDSAVPLTTGLVIVKVSEVEPPSPMLATPNVFAMLGGLATIRLAEAVFPVPPLVEDTLR